jgi:hypothetical protein
MEVENVINRTKKIMILITLSTYMTHLFALSDEKNYSQGLMFSFKEEVLVTFEYWLFSPIEYYQNSRINPSTTIKSITLCR